MAYSFDGVGSIQLLNSMGVIKEGDTVECVVPASHFHTQGVLYKIVSALTSFGQPTQSTELGVSHDVKGHNLKYFTQTTSEFRKVEPKKPPSYVAPKSVYLEEVEKEVNRLLLEGYKPVGGLSVAKNFWFQTMYRE